EDSKIERQRGIGPSVRGVKDFVFAPKAGKENGHTAQGHHAHGVGGKSYGHESFQPTHAANILFVVAAVNDGTSAEEKQGFEKGVRQEVKHSHGDPAHTEAHHHVAEL